MGVASSLLISRIDGLAARNDLRCHTSYHLLVNPGRIRLDRIETPPAFDDRSARSTTSPCAQPD